MVDIRGKTTQGQEKDVLLDKAGRVLVLEGGDGYIFTATGTGALSRKTTMGNVAPGRPWKLKHASLTFNTAPTTSQNITLTQNPGTKFADRPSTVLWSNNPSLTSSTSIVGDWEEGLKMQPGDEVTLAYTNTDARTVTAEIVVEVL